MELLDSLRMRLHSVKPQLLLRTRRYIVKNPGYCPCCERYVVFVAGGQWLRDCYLCSHCGCLPRERAIISIIKKVVPNYTELRIHESSPSKRGASLHLKTCPQYSSSQFFAGVPSGKKIRGVLCQDLHNMSFDDDTFDLFVTQDVFEHLNHPDLAFREIKRILKPGGCHIFTVPLINKSKASERRVSFKENGDIVFNRPPEYHGNPVSGKGSLVTFDWGYDIIEFIEKSSGMCTDIYSDAFEEFGIRAEYIDVLVSKKEARS